MSWVMRERKSTTSPTLSSPATTPRTHTTRPGQQRGSVREGREGDIRRVASWVDLDLQRQGMYGHSWLALPPRCPPKAAQPNSSPPSSPTAPCAHNPLPPAALTKGQAHKHQGRLCDVEQRDAGQLQVLVALEGINGGAVSPKLQLLRAKQLDGFVVEQHVGGLALLLSVLPG